MSSSSGQLSPIQEAGEAWLLQNTRLEVPQRRALTDCASSLVQRILAGRQYAIGIAGPPGTGKSTLAALMVHLLDRQGHSSWIVSLDDYYLPLKDRQTLSLTRHPLFLTRGVPGTHDLERLVADLDRLRAGDISGMKTPVFDKSRDDRAPPGDWRSVRVAPRFLLVEGWCLGAPPQTPAELELPLNELERMRDPDGAWRRSVNVALHDYGDVLTSRLDQFWYIKAPHWDCVVNWRWRQEQELASMKMGSRAQVASFLESYQRIVAHMHRTHPLWASLFLETDREHLIHFPEPRVDS